MSESRESILEKAYNLGFSYEQEYRGCSQCAIAAIQETLGIEDEAVFKAGTGLAGGILLTGTGTCGALCGGIMVLSSIAGRERKDFADMGGRLFLVGEMGSELRNKFIEEYGSISCRDIQYKLFGRSYNLMDPVDKEKFDKDGAHTDKCPSVVGNAARWAVELILELQARQ